MQNKKIWLSLAKMSGRELDYIKEAFDTNWVVPLGPNVDGFEKDLEEYLGQNRHVVALSSGTAALHLALILTGVQPGDEVICQSFTFAASANPIAYLGAKPIFIDSEPPIPGTWIRCCSKRP
jgi:dTDP-4-amino-4,6-dideoxygalactose transaminase